MHRAPASPAPTTPSTPAPPHPPGPSTTCRAPVTGSRVRVSAAPTHPEQGWQGGGEVTLSLAGREGAPPGRLCVQGRVPGRPGVRGAGFRELEGGRSAVRPEMAPPGADAGGGTGRAQGLGSQGAEERGTLEERKPNLHVPGRP